MKSHSFQQFPHFNKFIFIYDDLVQNMTEFSTSFISLVVTYPIS